MTGIERYVILTLDEIYVNLSVQYKGDELTGQATNNTNLEARTIQASMVHSAFGSFQEIVSLTPIKTSASVD